MFSNNPTKKSSYFVFLRGEQWRYANTSISAYFSVAKSVDPPMQYFCSNQKPPPYPEIAVCTFKGKHVNMNAIVYFVQFK